MTTSTPSPSHSLPDPPQKNSVYFSHCWHCTASMEFDMHEARYFCINPFCPLEGVRQPIQDNEALAIIAASKGETK